ncbi:MAG: FAD:protein FMN transferase, partial [candidate division WOR-3 bacterium]|nr:FAD:protein FMN transferase [candidate division WOR-3 bacterium]
MTVFIKKTLYAILFLKIIIDFFSCNHRKLNEYCYNGIIFGSYLKIIIPAKDSSSAQNLIQKTLAILYHIDSVASAFNQSSELSIINRQKMGIMSSDLKNLITKSLEIAENTKGAFDISVGSVLKEWGFYSRQKEAANFPPNDSFVVSYKLIQIRNDSIFIPQQISLDLGGIAVGYALDKAANFLKQSGVPYGLIDAGGDIICWGNRSFRIGIKNPESDGIIKSLKIENCAISTSGNYENYQTYDTVRYTHIINPYTKMPIASNTNSLVSVTIVANNCL